MARSEMPPRYTFHRRSAARPGTCGSQSHRVALLRWIALESYEEGVMRDFDDCLSPDFELFGLSRSDSETATAPPPPGRKVISITLKLITPMFGGSASAREVDPERPVNAKAIRGHLRFWWRACHAGRYRDATEMFQAEAEIWGAAGEYDSQGRPVLGPGAVDLEVGILEKGAVVNARNIIPRATTTDGPQKGVFLFPFDEQRRERIPPADALTDVRFLLNVYLSDSSFEQDVCNSLIAWILLGGVGARTRRGCGALQLEDGAKSLPRFPTDPDKLLEWSNGFRPRHSNDWTCLAGSRAVIGKPARSPDEAWRLLGRYWSALRKGHIGDIPYKPTGGGKWPDHHTLQRLLRKSDSLGLVKPYLGLPIVYQGMQGSFKGTVEPEESGRMASPVIVKPVAFGNKEIRPAVVVLNTPKPRRLKVGNTHFAVQIPRNDPLMQKYGDPLEAVLQSALERGNFGEGQEIMELGGLK